MKTFTFKAAALLIFSFVWTTQAEFARIGTKNYYLERNLTLNWFGAWNYCAVNGMKLITIDSAAETNALQAYLRPNFFRFWIAANELATPNRIAGDRNRQFRWATNGQPLFYTNWFPFQPNNALGNEHCIQVVVITRLLWNDCSCDLEQGFICEY